MLYLLSIALDFFHLATITDLEPSAQLRAGQAPSVNMGILGTCRHQSQCFTGFTAQGSPAFEHQCYPVVQPTLVEARPNLSKMTRISVSLGNKPTQSNPGREAARDLLQLLQLFTWLMTSKKHELWNYEAHGHMSHMSHHPLSLHNLPTLIPWASPTSKAWACAGLFQHLQQGLCQPWRNHQKFESPRVGPRQSQFFPSFLIWKKLLDYARLPKAPAHLVPGLPLASLEPFASCHGAAFEAQRDELPKPKKDCPENWKGFHITSAWLGILQLLQIWVRTRQPGVSWLHTYIILPNQQSFFTTPFKRPCPFRRTAPQPFCNAWRASKLQTRKALCLPGQGWLQGIRPVTLVCFHTELHSKRQPKTGPKCQWHGNRNLQINSWENDCENMQKC